MKSDQMYYKKEGKGKPIVLLHGLSDNHKMWKKIYPYLRNYMLLLPDLPGHGKSKFEKVSWFIFTNEINKMMEKEAIEKAVFIGFSLGGMAALKYAIEHPNKVEALVLVSSSAYLQKRQRFQEAVEDLFNITIKNLKEGIAVIKGTDEISPEIWLQVLKMVFSFDLRNKIKKGFSIPSLVITSKRDLVISPRYQKETAGLMNAKHVIIDSVHSSINFDPDLVGKNIKEFLECLKY